MNRYTSYIIMFLLLVSKAAFNQTITLPQNAFFKYILKDRTAFQNYGSSNFLFITQPIQQINTQQIVKIKNDIYILVNGTGQVYNSISYDSTQITLQRIDSSYFTGYNFDSFYYINNEEIYSFGGYGFWRDNGHLRKLDRGNGWQIVPLNQEVPFCNSRNLYHFNNANLYWILNTIRNEGILNGKSVDSCYILNFNNASIQSLGKSLINNNNVNSVGAKIDLPFGVLVENYFNNNVSAIFDFKNNVILKAKQKAKLKLPENKGKYSPIQFYGNGFIYSVSFPSNIIDSVKFDMNDFEKTEFRIYEPKTKVSEFGVWFKTNKFWLIFVILCILPYFFFFKRKHETILNEKSTPISNFEIWETELLKELVNKISSKGYLSVDDFNLKLGVSNKSLEVQKKTRNDYINTVNEKYRILNNTDEDLIVRERDEADRRVYKYKISEKDLKVISKFLDK